MAYKNTKRIPLIQAGIKIDSELYKKVWLRAEELQTTFSEIVRIALNEYFETNQSS